MPAYVVTLLIGLIAGSAIGYLLSALKSKDSVGNQALLDDYKAQLDAERGKTESAIKLNAELMAVKESVAKLSTQSNEANRIRTEAEAKLNTQFSKCVVHLSPSLMRPRRSLVRFLIHRPVESLARHS